MRVFICSTCYDLVDLRAELEIFFREAGIEPVLSESLSSEFQVVPDRNSIETCLANVRNCDEFLIILSNRYGPSLAKAGFEDVSATHLEYREAVKAGKKIRMFVRDLLEADYAIWKSNDKAGLKLSWCKEQRDWKIFDLLGEHRKLAKDSVNNNWVYFFRDSAELKRNLTREFKDMFALAAVAKLSQSGRVPFFEISSSFLGYNAQAKKITFELLIRNLSNAVAVLPRLEILNTTNDWTFKSLAREEQISLKSQWAYNAPISLSTKLSYSILEGHKFVDEGVLTIKYVAQAVRSSEVRYVLATRRYLGPSTEMVLIH
jgi:hypothetical protein